MRLFVGLISLVLVAAWSGSVSGQTAFAFENWRGYFTISADGNFKACFAEAEYSSGNRLQIWLTPDQELFFSLRQKGVVDPNQRTARIWVDGAAPSQAVIQYYDPITIFSVGSLKKKVAELFEAIRMGNVLFVEIGGAVHKFSLRGTYGALSELVGCANLVRMGQPPLALASEKDTQTRAARRDSAPPSPPSKAPAALAGTATAFVVSPAGHLLTNAHAVEECQEIKVAMDQGELISARVVAVDKRNDLALLAAKDIGVPPMAFRKSLPRLGESVYAYGFPLRSLLSSSGNFTSGMISALVGMKDDSSQLQISAPVQPGNSGGPLLDAKGAAIGVIVSKLNAIGVAERTGDIPQNVNFAIKSAVALTFLEAHDVAPRLADTAPDLSPADVAEIARRSTLRLDCFK